MLESVEVTQERMRPIRFGQGGRSGRLIGAERGGGPDERLGSRLLGRDACERQRCRRRIHMSSWRNCCASPSAWITAM